MMFDSPMHSMDDGIKYVIDSEHGTSSSSSRGTPQCWKCGGTGRLVVKNRIVKTSLADKQGDIKSDQCDSSIIPNIVSYFKECSESGVTTYFKECPICCNKVTFPSLDSNTGKISQFTSYTATGPAATADCRNPLFHPQKGESLCSLSGHYMIYQSTKGHRFTTDDVCTAYFAYFEMKDAIAAGNDMKEIENENESENLSDERNNPEISGNKAGNVKNERNVYKNIERNENENESATSHLDLGCGLGSVLLMMKWKFGSAIHR